jgi:hypothetical protein
MLALVHHPFAKRLGLQQQALKQLSQVTSHFMVALHTFYIAKKDRAKKYREAFRFLFTESVVVKLLKELFD